MKFTNIVFLAISIAQVLTGMNFLKSNSIIERDKHFAIAGRYLLGFGMVMLLIAVVQGVWIITFPHYGGAP